MIFPIPKKSGESDQSDDCPEEYSIHKNLFMLFKGDPQKMEWFYCNKTRADLTLWVILYNMTGGYGDVF